MAFTSSYTDGLIQQSEYFYGTPDMSLTSSLSVDGTSRTLFTSCSLVYSGSNVTQVTQSFNSGNTQITDILYSGSFADGNPLSIAVTGSDGVNKLYTLTYSASLVTQILVT